MLKILTNAEQKLTAELMRIRTLELAQPQILAAGALETRNAVVDRIHEQGLNTAGQPLRTKARNPDGAYSRRHGKARRRRGLQIGKVDFTFSGDTLDNWSVIVRGPMSVVLAFRSSEAQRKAGELEDYFGTTFTPNDPEIQKSTDLIEKRTKQLLG